MRLIDADALKEELNKKGVVGRFNTLLLIDNAPTVERLLLSVFAENVDEKAVADLKAELQSVIEARPLQSVIEARPQGEWGPCYENYKNGMFYRDCSICGKATMTGDWKFCPYCGAEMKGGAE